MSSKMFDDEEILAIENGDFYEISLVPAGSQTGDEGFMVQKVDKSAKQEGDEDMADETEQEKEQVNLEDLSKDDKLSLINKLKEDLDTKTKIKVFLDGEEVEQSLKEKFSEDKEEKDEDETEKESDMTPKAREAIKTVLSTLSKVSDEVPPNYHWVYEALAKLVDETAPEMGKVKKSAETEITDDVKEAVNKSVETLEEADELSEQESMIKSALEGMVVEKEEDEDQEEISKEAKEEIEKYKGELEKIKKEKQELQEKQLKQELTKKADSLENIPEGQDKLTELYAELYKADQDLFEKVENLLKKVDKQSEVGELFTEKGHRATPDQHKDESPNDKLDRLIKEAVENGEAENRFEATEKILDEKPDLYEEVKGDAGSK